MNSDCYSVAVYLCCKEYRCRRRRYTLRIYSDEFHLSESDAIGVPQSSVALLPPPLLADGLDRFFIGGIENDADLFICVSMSCLGKGQRVSLPDSLLLYHVPVTPAFLEKVAILNPVA